MNNSVKTFVYNSIIYVVCCFIVSFCWFGLEYILDGTIHSSVADDIVACILSGFIFDRLMNKYVEGK